MNKAQKKIVGDYMRDIFDLVGLRDWFFWFQDAAPKLGPAPTEDESGPIAEISREDGRKVAYIRLAANFLDLSDDEKRASVVHEALHCHFTDLNALVEKDLACHLGEQAYDLFRKSFSRALEYGIDAVAYEWAKKLPPFPDLTPPKPKRRKKSGQAKRYHTRRP